MNNKGFKNFGWSNNSATKTQDVNTFSVGTGSDESTCTVKDGSIAEVVLSGVTATNLLGSYGNISAHAVEYATAGTYGDAIYIEYSNMVKTVSDVVCLDGKYGDTGHRAYFQFPITNGHKYYACCKVYGTTKIEKKAGTTFTTVSRDDTSWGYITLLLTADATTTEQIRIMSSYGTEDSGYFATINVIDLTATFGSGNEPTEAWCLANIPYFDGTKSLTNPTVTSKNSDGDTVDTVSYSGTVASGATVKLRPRVRTGGSLVVADDIGYGGLATSTKYHTAKNQGFKNV